MAVIFKVMLVATVFWSAVVCSDPNYAGHPAADALIEEMVQEHDFKREGLLALFAAAQRKDSILEAIARPAEKTKAWYEYRAIFLNEKREVQGVEFYNEHRDTLLRAERKLGVPAHVIVSVIGVETYYGRNAGSYRVIDALSTLAFDYPKRSTFFTKELKNFLMLTRDQGLDPLAFKGSYAGAMGYGQFMPSSYRSYAIDFDDDGLIDIWNNPVDAIGSVANYFKKHGWRSGEMVVVPAQAKESVADEWFVQSRADLKPKNNIAEFSLAGITTEHERPGSELATAMKFELEDGYEYWLGLHNFYVITRYNHSAMYAMSVHQLSERLAGQFPR
ncbi:MAG: membrane-bound lytic murein transglycosylase B [Halioglobus sp.]|jgi:membrane-bound lytic murein transglycosylase B